MTPEIHQLRLDYIMSHHKCAYCQVLPKALLRELRSQPHTIELEHVWQRASKKIDHPANYVMTCRPCHEWKHANTVLGRLAALYWKQKHNEFDRETLRELIGRDPVGWVSNQLENGLPEWADELARSILENY